MFEAEDVGMVDDIVRLLMGEGNVVEVTKTENVLDITEAQEFEENQDSNSETKTTSPGQEGTEEMRSAMPSTEETFKMENSQSSENLNGNTPKSDPNFEIKPFGGY